MTALVLFAHGSPVESANLPVRDLAREVGTRVGAALSEAAFLECTAPDLPTAVDGLIQRGATRIVVVPYFLTLGLHLKRDLPRIVKDLRDIYSSVAFDVAAPLEGHPALLRAVIDRAEETIYGGGSSESKAG